MALHAFPHLPATSHFPSSRLLSGPLIFKTQSFSLICRPIGISRLPGRQSRRRIPVARVVEESQENSEPEALSESEEQEQQPAVASELKKAMQERKDKEGDNLWSGVAQEIREIEWPSFGKVLGTTGVVLSVILGSSVVLLTVNAVLAELSDRVFAGRGVQDFFT